MWGGTVSTAVDRLGCLRTIAECLVPNLNRSLVSHFFGIPLLVISGYRPLAMFTDLRAVTLPSDEVARSLTPAVKSKTSSYETATTICS